MTDAFRLKPTFAARIWGRDSLAPWYTDTGMNEKVGEAWLTGPKSVVETGPEAGKTLAAVSGDIEFPLLVKMLFPNDKLSVQVHPNDEEAVALGLTRGKTECWYVLEADPGASVACGLKKGTEVADVLQSIAAGTLEDLLEMISVVKGDMIFVDAGTVHAIGPGVTLLEVQQTCDVTYRLYDYGRPRELHLEAGLAVVKTETDAGTIKPKVKKGFVRLIETRYFVVDRYDLEPGQAVTLENPSAGCIVGLEGKGSVAGVEIVPGQAAVLPQGSSTIETDTGLTFVWSWEPSAA